MLSARVALRAKLQNGAAMKIARDERGLITLDFIFALMLAFGFSSLFFAVSVTLSLVEVGQYVTFATSRAYAGAHETAELQKSLGEAKYAEVMALPAFKTFFGLGWVKLDKPQLGDFMSEYPETNQSNTAFEGARVKMDARLLHLRIPFLGPTAEDSTVGQAVLNSYLMREVSTTECREQFTRQRYEKLKNLNGAPYGAAPQGEAKLITDNGC